MGDEFGKKFAELLEHSAGRVLVAGRAGFSVTTFLPYILRSLLAREVRLVLCGENFGRVAQLLKRVGLGSADFAGLEVVDLFARLAAWVEPDYPITRTAHKHAPAPPFAPSTPREALLASLGRLLAEGSEAKAVVIPGLEYLLMAVLAEAGERAAIGLIDALLGLQCGLLVVGINEDFFTAREHALLRSWLSSHFDARLKLCALKTGSSQDVTGLLKTRRTDPATLASVKRTIRFKAHGDRVTFSGA